MYIGEALIGASGINDRMSNRLLLLINNFCVILELHIIFGGHSATKEKDIFVAFSHQ